jgi:glutamate racemase
VHEGPIGVFDSGLGGLTVLQALADLLPHEDLLYLGDTARYPYGDRDAAELRRFSTQISELLVAAGAKMIVVACNSATAAALPHLRAAVDVPVIGVVEPALRAAAAVTEPTHRTVVIGTRMTATSGVYERAAAGLRPPLRIDVLACPGFVELVEEGETSGPRATAVVARRLAPLLEAGAPPTDTLVLGCTHYPLLARVIGEVLGRDVTLVSSADETAFEIRELLERTGWLTRRRRPGRRTYLTTGDPARFRALGERFLGFPLGDVRGHRWPAEPAGAGEADAATPTDTSDAAPSRRPEPVEVAAQVLRGGAE